MPEMEFALAACLFTIVIGLCILVGNTNAQLCSTFYEYSCPALEAVVQPIVEEAVANDPRNAASLLRLHFHDCFVNGCDASVLLDDIPPTFTGEKTAIPNNNSLRGFEIIDEIKTAVEDCCSCTVSCADILAIAARDSVVLVGGPSWDVMLGRRDSRTASRSTANAALPFPNETLSTLISKFKAVGLSTEDTVSLSGAHTIGRSRCANFRSRLYNFNQTGKPDPSIHPLYLNSLRGVCPSSGNANVLANLDATTKDTFDNNYFMNLKNQQGLLQSDQELTASATIDLVNLYSQSQDAFFSAFQTSMINMGNINPLTGDEGEIRTNCRTVN